MIIDGGSTKYRQRKVASVMKVLQRIGSTAHVGSAARLVWTRPTSPRCAIESGQSRARGQPDGN